MPSHDEDLLERARALAARADELYETECRRRYPDIPAGKRLPEEIASGMRTLALVATLLERIERAGNAPT